MSGIRYIHAFGLHSHFRVETCWNQNNVGEHDPTKCWITMIHHHQFLADWACCGTTCWGHVVCPSPFYGHKSGGKFSILRHPVCYCVPKKCMVFRINHAIFFVEKSSVTPISKAIIGSLFSFAYRRTIPPQSRSPSWYLENPIPVTTESCEISDQCRGFPGSWKSLKFLVDAKWNSCFEKVNLGRLWDEYGMI